MNIELPSKEEEDHRGGSKMQGGCVTEEGARDRLRWREMIRCGDP